jgi:hypothetical protein
VQSGTIEYIRIRILFMLHTHLKRHRYTVVVGVPIVVLLASSLSFMRSPEEVCIVPEDNRFVEVGETVTLHVIADAKEPVNVIGATLLIPEESLTVETISREGSIIDLWSEEPVLSEESRIKFSGGIVSPTGFLGNGIVLTLVVTPLAEGETSVSFEDVHMLAHDGTGKEVSCGNNPVTLSVRAAERPSPDLNNDNVVNIFDFGIISSRLFFTYNKEYDLNQDGKITLADIGIVISNMGNNENQGSLALFWSR